MERIKIKQLIGFYENELTNNILSFWMPRCLDNINGGYFNCFDNEGKKLTSHDKYTWSQGRFVWMFAKLATIQSTTFTKEQRSRFMELSKNGCEFLMKHCLMGRETWRCVFLMDEEGKPKHVDGWDSLDMSIYADCFVIAGMSKYAQASGDKRVYEFAKKLYESCVERVCTNNFNTFPYPLSKEYRAHGIPMIFSNVTKELYDAAQIFDKEYIVILKNNLDKFTTDILENFVDENNVLHEVIRKNNEFFPQLLGQHSNPGHTIEDMWFMMDAVDILNKVDRIEKITAITKKALENGWDSQYGGLLHFCGVDGGEPIGDTQGVEDEPMMKQTFEGWSDKLWWIHSEALYTALLCYSRSGDEDFLKWHDKVFDYTFSHFPSPDREIREWRQILLQNGQPQNKVVALPVKDPYHIVRNLTLIIELLYKIDEQSDKYHIHKTIL